MKKINTWVIDHRVHWSLIIITLNNQTFFFISVFAIILSEDLYVYVVISYNTTMCHFMTYLYLFSFLTLLSFLIKIEFYDFYPSKNTINNIIPEFCFVFNKCFVCFSIKYNVPLKICKSLTIYICVQISKGHKNKQHSSII